MKSKFVFLILFFGYVFIAIGDLFAFVTSGQEILFGLSLSALLMSLSDCATGVTIGLCQRNEMRYITKCSSRFIEDKLKKKVFPVNQGINIRNVKKNLEEENPKFEISKHPNEFKTNILVKLLKKIEIIFFAISIFAFVVSPFFSIPSEVIEKATIIITLFAFGFMCLNIFIAELNDELSKRKMNFINNTQIHINSVYTDFSYWLNNQLFCREDLKAAQKEVEENENFGLVDILTENNKELDDK